MMKSVVLGCLLLVLFNISCQEQARPTRIPAVGGEAHKVDPTTGFIRDWLILAPIEVDDPAGSVEKEQVPGEAKFQPLAGDKVKVGDKELTWKPVAATDYYFDINELLGDQVENAAGYGVTYVEAPREMSDVTIALCSNDEGRLYLNGMDVYKFEGTRSISEDADTVEHVTLKAGVNVIVFKVINETNNWQGCVRFLGKGGKPITDLTVWNGK
jgi:hypothetical protein